MMPNDYAKEAQNTVAIRPGVSGGSTFLQADYDPETWERMVRATQLNPKAHNNARLVMRGTFEADCIKHGIPSIEELASMDSKELKKLCAKAKVTGEGSPELLAAKLFDKLVSEAGIQRNIGGETDIDEGSEGQQN